MKTVNVDLYAPPAYVSASADVRAQVSNGCGPGGWLNDIVPDTLWGLKITPACDIHDWMYVAGETVADKNEADDVFRNNLLRLVSAAGGPWWLRWLRRRRVMVYFAAVRHFGGPWFWNGKNPIDHKYTTALLISRTWYLNWDSLLLSWIKRLFTSR